MLLRTFFDPKLAHNSYLVACQASGEAIVIDPARNIEPYLETALAEGIHIVAVAETHIHADFLSGARELAERAVTKLYLSGEGGQEWHYDYATDYTHSFLRDGDTIILGNVQLEAIHTPGHTPEHLCYVLTDCARLAEPVGVFTGDCLFVGDVGRPDLLETAVGVRNSKAAAAKDLYASVQRLRQLPDYAQLWPAHGAGSACGKALGAVPVSTIGYECHANWAFQTASESSFVETVLAGQPEPPRYFGMMKRLNKEGPALLTNRSMPPHLMPNQLANLLQAGAPIIDTRSPKAFANGHLSGTINIPYSSRTFVTYAGSFLDYETPFYLIIAPEDAESAQRDLQRIGLDKLAGYFSPSAVTAQPAPSLATIPQVTAADYAAAIQKDEIAVIDVRSAAEFGAGHLPHARHIALGNILTQLAAIPRDEPIILQCLSGFRSSIAAGLLSSRGYSNVMNLQGGYQAWQRLG